MNGRTVLVTGTHGGLGSAVVDEFVGAGWRVLAPVRRPRDTGRPEVVEVAADLTDPAAVGAAVEAAAADPAAPLRAVVNLVGGYGGGTLVHETSVDEVERLLAINVRPTFLATSLALPHLLRNGGAVVCMGARAALAPFATGSAYALSKAAVLAFSNGVAADYKQRGVRCNTVLPSVIDTPQNRREQPDADFGKWVPPAEIAAVIRFLASDESAPTSGAAIPVYGRA
ncbi:NAD(P)-dependent dehydrogenase (short-subunit alcohol dehydrogenase family) [Asanoa ferruginea]|uniref:NAD(P)-dependent dehydrogenase (Short-subunit alcohol dehydrogenase family) n=1 Tax=Asanoa ferruginea TaxID=53367 RepID=A0A3D9ZDB3_9ACTN|nr:SDR family NAD(P)-dependent oxidoreductase [Asanoa ferruginea]REF94494.1 NAD(P)-dependent dehydrogenase (short-subunit alcohol dehydrogenase family) [Asanoa ferruginea]GIF52514.1 short-chain dehydrogenase [Asanoa ferruginea]